MAPHSGTRYPIPDKSRRKDGQGAAEQPPPPPEPDEEDRFVEAKLSEARQLMERYLSQQRK